MNAMKLTQAERFIRLVALYDLGHLAKGEEEKKNALPPNTKRVKVKKS